MQNKKTADTQNISPSSQANVTGLKKYATLSPYLSEIQKRKKTKSLMRPQRRRNQNESSSKSFRIKQTSTTSLHKKQKETIKNLVSKISTTHKNQKKDKRANSVERVLHPSNLTTIKYDKGSQSSKNTGLFQELYVKVQNKHRRENSFRKNLYDHKSKIQKKKSQQKSKDQFDFNAYGYTEGNRRSNLETQKKTQQIGRKNNFRKNKYQALYSSVTSNDVKDEKIHEPVKSQNKFDFNKKQSNASINKEMDQIAKKQMERFYRQMRSKQIEKSIEKSTQKYFKHSNNYRPLKSNNDIEIYISTAKNPSRNKVSGQSTQNTQEGTNSAYVSSIKDKKKPNELLEYDFDFQEGEHQITEIQNPSQEESYQFVEQSSFQKQRKHVEKEYFDKHEPNIEWSEEDCQIDMVC